MMVRGVSGGTLIIPHTQLYVQACFFYSSLVFSQYTDFLKKSLVNSIIKTPLQVLFVGSKQQFKGYASSVYVAVNLILILANSNKIEQERRAFQYTPALVFNGHTNY